MAATTPAKSTARPAAKPAKVALAGLLSGCDNHGKLRVLLVRDFADGTPDYSLQQLFRVAPRSAGDVPYKLDEGPDVAGVLGEFWVTAPRSGYQRRAIDRLVAELRGKEIVVFVTPVPYRFTSTAGHNYGAEVCGTRLEFSSLTARAPKNGAAASQSASV